MNIFGSFTFGSLIKTFLPGFVCLCALYLLYATTAKLTKPPTDPWAILSGKDQTTLALLVIPVSILLGLISNIFVFTRMNDWLVREPFKQKNKEVYPLYVKLTTKLRDDCWTATELDTQSLSENFKEYIDPDIILVERLGFAEIAYVREQYWYHLEFQLNLIVSIVFLTLMLMMFLALSNGTTPPVLLALVALALVSFFSVRWLLDAARKNYSRHVAKICSLLVALLSRPKAAETDAK